MLRRTARSIVAFLAACLVAAPAHALLFRAYLASDGNDANPCTLASPCRLLPAALAAVASGGEIWMLDSANYNTAPVDVTKSVTILAIPGALGSVVATGGNAINIATPGVKLALRNLMVVPLAGAGGHGVFATAGSFLSVENCLFANLVGTGIRIEAPLRVSVVDTILRGNSYGIVLDNGAEATISRVHAVQNLNIGVWAVPSVDSTVVMYVSDTVASDNSYGIAASGATNRIAKAYVSRSVASGNYYNGFYAYSANAATDSFMELSGSVAFANQYGIINFGATLESAGDNRSSGNSVGNTFGTITVTPSK